jgi:TP901 family phage tail tape measure protein
MKGLVGLTDTEIAGFSETIKALAVETGKPPVELARAMENITSSGVKGEAAIETLVATSRAAAGGLGEVRSVSDTVTSAMNAYGVANLSATDATDILVAAVREGKAEAETFAPVLGSVLPIATEMGIGFDEAAGSIAYLTLSTGSASTAATQYSNLLAQIIRLKPNKEAGKILTQAGVDIEAFQKRVADEGMLPALMGLKTQLAGVGLSMKDAFPDVQAMTAALQMTGANSDQAARVLEGVANAAGSVDSAFAAAQETTQFKLNQAMAELKVTMIEIGDIIAPIMARMNHNLRLGVAQWNSLSRSTKETVVTIMYAASMIGPALIGMAAAAAALPHVTASLKTLASSFGLVRYAATLAWLAATGPVAATLIGMAAVGSIVAGLAYLIIGPEGLKYAWDVSKEAVINFVNGAMGFMANFSTNMQAIFVWLQTNWFTVLTDMGNMIVTLATNGATNFGVLIQTMINLLSAFTGWLTIAIPAAFNVVFNYKVIEYILEFVGKMIGYFGSFLYSLGQMFAQGLQIVIGVFISFGKAVVGIVVGLAGVIGKAISGILSGSIPNPIEMMKEFGAVIAEKAVELAGEAGEKMVAATTAINSALQEEGRQMAESFDAGASDMNFMNTATDIVQDGLSQMKGPLDGFKSELTDLPELIFSREGEAVKAATDAVTDGQGAVKTGIEDIVKGAQDSVAGLDDMNKDIKDGVDELGNSANDSGKSVGALADKAIKAAGAVEGVLQGSLSSAIKIDEYQAKLVEAAKEKEKAKTTAKAGGSQTTQDTAGNTHEGRVEKLLSAIAENTKNQFGPANLAS